ncbi:putative leucine-rich repeat-containing protein DDB_G0290503 isoform X2 [Euwallacea fornicatus]|uniref:putative leucine-rich repeat-containing protein DDB_G0290503 isoform X2 n=1 Tax=Euwallacea fornicatus TaxID=995702 RepID=UPI00338DE78B
MHLLGIIARARITKDIMDNEYQQILPKVSGYLEKKGRKKMMSCYKKYWFVLEGRLLLYYKSKDEYDAISPCKGSINLGPTSNVKPGNANSGVFQIESKTTTITLRAESKDDQHKWIEALISALNQRSEYRKLNHFRYSTSDLSPVAKKALLDKQKTLPSGFDSGSVDFQMTIIEKLQKMGARSYGIGPKLRRSKTTLARTHQMSYSNDSLPSKNNDELRLHKTGSVIIDNDCYTKISIRNSIESVEASSEGIYERIPSSDSVFIQREASEGLNNNRSPPLMTENDAYWTKYAADVPESGYRVIDNNDNIQPGDTKELEEENIYAEADLKNVKSSERLENDKYVDLENLRTSSTSSQGSADDKERKTGLFGIGRKNKCDKDSKEDKKGKIKKSESFLHRVWSKKSRNKKNKNISLSATDIVDKGAMSDSDTLKTLSELQQILQRQNGGIKLHERTSTVSAMELGNIEMVYCESDDALEKNTTGFNDEIISHNAKGPSLPPRNHSQSTSKSSLTPIYKEVPVQHPPAVPPKMKRKRHSDATLDQIYSDYMSKQEILEEVLKNKDIDAQKKEGKVRELIKKFSKEAIAHEEGVELRNKDPESTHKCEMFPTNSKDLDKLLEELSKITTAPIMTPGVTISLINPEISDKDIQKMAPIRRRRLSDPDYDVPRPHRSLVNIRKRDENALQATRFFGPILQPSDFEDCELPNRPSSPPTDYHSNIPSMTPDSLETDNRKRDSVQCQSHDELRTISYDSHNYLRYNKESHQNLNLLIETNYSDSRLFFKSNNSFSSDSQDIVNLTQTKTDQSDNFFVDSLDP